jgi:hypothetical protein
VGIFFEYGNDHSGSALCEEFLDKVIKYLLLKKNWSMVVVVVVVLVVVVVVVVDDDNVDRAGKTGYNLRLKFGESSLF